MTDTHLEPIAHRLGALSYLAGSIGHMLVIGNFTVLWFYRSPAGTILTVLGWGVSVIDVWHEDSPPVAELVNRRGFWVGMFFVQGIRARRPVPSMVMAGVVAAILLLMAWRP